MPSFLVAAFGALSSEEGLKAEGIFRKAGNEAKLRALQEPFFRGLPGPGHLSPFDVAALIKKFLRELATPLFLNELFQVSSPSASSSLIFFHLLPSSFFWSISLGCWQSELLSCYRQIKHEATLLKALRELINIMPLVHRDTLAFLCLQLKFPSFFQSPSV